MAKYLFECIKCNEYMDVVQSIKDDLKTPNCLNCGELMTRDYSSEFQTHTICSEVDKLKVPEIGNHATDDRKARAAKIQTAIANEPFNSISEVREARDIAKEEEKKRNLVAGTILGGRTTPKNDAEKAEIQKRDTKKKNAARKARGIHT